VIEDEVDVWARDDDAELLEQLEGAEQDVGRAVSPGRLKAKADVAVVGKLEALGPTGGRSR